MVIKVKTTRCNAPCGNIPAKYALPTILSKYKITNKTNAAEFTRPFAKLGKIRLNISTALVALNVDNTTGLYGVTIANCIKNLKNTSKIATFIKIPNSVEVIPIGYFSYLYFLILSL